jgi:hypothetical protein
MADLEYNGILTADEWFTNGKGVVTLCGSTKFFVQCMEANRQLTFKGWMVLMCGSWGHSYHKDLEGNSGADYEAVKTLHFKKILSSNAIVVVTDGTHYMGESTRAEITFAKFYNLPIFYFDGGRFTGKTVVESKDRLAECDLFIVDYLNRGGSLGF